MNSRTDIGSLTILLVTLNNFNINLSHDLASVFLIFNKIFLLVLALFFLSSEAQRTTTRCPLALFFPCQTVPFTCFYFILLYFIFFYFIMFIFEREGETQSVSEGGAERERETQNPKQVPGSELSTQNHEIMT